jgi:hypothetical protein
MVVSLAGQLVVAMVGNLADLRVEWLVVAKAAKLAAVSVVM